MAEQALITSAFRIHDCISTMRDVSTEETHIDALSEAALHSLDCALAIPARNFSDVRMKLMAVMADAGCGLIEVENVAVIARDLDMLIGRLQ